MWCRSNARRLRTAPLPFHPDAHYTLLIAAHDPRSICSVTGRSLFTLTKIGERLSIDRIVPGLGYVPGNMRLLALSLNMAKQDGIRIPAAAIQRLTRRLERTVEDRFSHRP